MVMGRIAAALIFSLIASGLHSACIKKQEKIPIPAKIIQARTVGPDELISMVNRWSRAVSSLQSASLLVDAERGGVDQGKIERYRSAPGYLFLERPRNIRLKILIPVAKTTLFDMASDGKRFEVWYPRQMKFFFGEDLRESPPAGDPDKKDLLGNFRPQHLVDALLLEEVPIDEPGRWHFVREEEDGSAKYYVVGVASGGREGRLKLEREIWIERSEMEIVRQRYFGPDGRVTSDISYSDYRVRAGVAVPFVVRIERPGDHYAFTIKFKELDLNVKFRAGTFSLPRPPAGAEMVELKS